MKRTSVLVSVLGTLGVLLATAAGAQTYPTKSVRIVAPFPPGGVADVLARAIQPGLQEALGQQVVIDNKPGAGGNIGAEIVAKAEPDGYTLLLASAGILTINEFLYSKMPFDTATAFSPITVVGDMPNIVVVNPKTAINTLKELIDRAKSLPGKLNFGSAGNGTTTHLAIVLLEQAAGIRLAHVPYKGAAPAVQDVLGGQVPFMFVDSVAGFQNIQAGKLRAIGIATPQRSKVFPDVPTLDEQGLKGFEAYAWQGLVVPKATPEDRVKRLSEQLQATLKDPAVVKRLEDMGLEVTSTSRAEMEKFLVTERNKLGPVIKSNNIQLD